MNEEIFPYDFIVRYFKYNNAEYRVALTPELYPDDGGLDFTGNYIGILISSTKITQSFHLTPDPHTRWDTEPKGMDPGLVDELDKIIRESRAN